mmetsp:Transcript_20916/g.70837  ORF Transcript_20916/g.70837 Transcript_20916/m.70837 type:complete len:282 (+) Transcript_20916:1803-2648(+)
MADDLHLVVLGAVGVLHLLLRPVALVMQTAAVVVVRRSVVVVRQGLLQPRPPTRDGVRLRGAGGAPLGRVGLHAAAKVGPQARLIVVAARRSSVLGAVAAWDSVVDDRDVVRGLVVHEDEAVRVRSEQAAEPSKGGFDRRVATGVVGDEVRAEVGRCHHAAVAGDDVCDPVDVFVGAVLCESGLAVLRAFAGAAGKQRVRLRRIARRICGARRDGTRGARRNGARRAGALVGEAHHGSMARRGRVRRRARRRLAAIPIHRDAAVRGLFRKARAGGSVGEPS